MTEQMTWQLKSDLQILAYTTLKKKAITIYADDVHVLSDFAAISKVVHT